MIAFARKRGERDRNTGISVLQSFLHFGTSAVTVRFSDSQAQGVICTISPERDPSRAACVCFQMAKAEGAQPDAEILQAGSAMQC